MNGEKIQVWLTLLLGMIILVPAYGIGQDEESVYFNRLVENAEGEKLDRPESDISYTAFLNGEQDTILTEDAPRWNSDASNWDQTNGLVGVELQNFTHFGAGDTVHLRFTDLVSGKRGGVSQYVESVPWTDPDPLNDIIVESMDLPTRPQNVSLEINSEYDHTINWNRQSDYTYVIYRRVRQDTIFDGSERGMYVRIADQIDANSYTDTETDTSKSYGYIVYARSSSGRLSAHSNEVKGTTTQGGLPQSVLITKRVESSTGNPIDRLPPNTSYTTYLNSDRDTILTEQSPRRDGVEKTIDEDNSIFVVEVRNFTDFSLGDTVYVRFTDAVIGERNTYSTAINSLPWQDPNPLNALTLQTRDIPSRPSELSLNIDENNHYTISWSGESDLTYSIFRRTRQDTLQDGRARRLYVKLAEGLESTSYTDESTDPSKDYAYIVYARNQQGNVSPHSAEIKQEKSIQGLQVASKKATNVTLSWDPFNYLDGRVAGYNIYRRREGGSYGNNPISYEDRATEFTDSRLEPGQTYYYKIKARSMQLNEVRASNEVKVTTRSSREGYTTYANFKTAVVLYRYGPSVFGGNYRMTDAEVEDMKFLIEKVRDFIWRNSGMQLNLEVDYISFNEYKELSENNHAPKTGNHLQNDRGVVNTQYDIVFRLAPSVGGYISYGATNALGMTGPDRPTGFSWMRWPYRNFAVGGFENFPAIYPEINYQETGNNLIWTFTHEIQHAIDGVYNNNGQPEMGHGDNPQFYGLTNIEDPSIGCCYPGFPEHYTRRFGRRFDFQGTLFRDFRDYKDLQSDWGDIYEANDADGDGMPDNDPRVPLDEERFGSSPGDADSDGDGYSDLHEAIDGIFEYSVTDPGDSDTDGDGIVDGEDPHPRYPIDTRIKTTGDGFHPSVDGNIDEWPEHTLVNDTVSKVERDRPFAPKVYMAYSSDSLYVALDLPANATPQFRWDFDDNGYWYGSGNTTLEINPDQGEISQLRTWDASPDARDLDEQIHDDVSEGYGNGVWDNISAYGPNFGGPIFTDSDVVVESRQTSPGQHIEIAISKEDRANLTLQDHNRIGFQLDYSDVFDDGLGAKTFDWWSYVYLEFSGLQATSVSTEEESPLSFKLEQNYPNPFNPTTTIPYSLGKSGNVTLKVYDVLGREVTTLVNKRQSPGTYEVQFNAGELSSGVYYYRLKAGEKTRVEKLMLMK